MKRNILFVFGTCIVISFFLLLSGCGQVEKSIDSSTSTSWYDFQNHVVLVEIFTDFGCPPCHQAVPSMEILAEENNTQTVEAILAEYHIWDSYKTDETVQRFNDYKAYYTASVIAGIPTIIFDGNMLRLGYLYGSDTYGNYNTYNTALHFKFGSSKLISIEALAGINASQVTVTGSLSNESNSSLNDLILNTLILKDYGTRESHYIVKDIVTKEIASLPSGTSFDFILTSEVLTDTASISAVVFLQKSNKEVIDSMLSKLW